MTNIRLIFSALSLAAITPLAGCGSGESVPPGSGTTTLQADVYIAGFTTNPANIKLATIWKNGIPTTLSNGTYPATAYSIAVSGGNTYVCGLQNNGTYNVLELWVNGVETALTDGKLQGSKCSVAVSGSDVYVSGGEAGYDANGNYIDVAGYWKNGSFVQLISANTAGQNGGGVSSIVVTSANVDVLGNQNELLSSSGSIILNSIPILWKDGVSSPITNGSQYATANSIAVSGTDIYVGGSICQTVEPDCQHAVYWKNGTLTQLSSDPDSVVSGIAVSATTVFASGNTSVPAGFSAEYWENGVPTILDQSTSASANGIVVSGSDVYVVGSQSGGACYWKNGVLQSVTAGGATSVGYGIAVIQPS
jgi:hypothetical protein